MAHFYCENFFSSPLFNSKKHFQNLLFLNKSYDFRFVVFGQEVQKIDGKSSDLFIPQGSIYFDSVQHRELSFFFSLSAGWCLSSLWINEAQSIRLWTGDGPPYSSSSSRWSLSSATPPSKAQWPRPRRPSTSATPSPGPWSYCNDPSRSSPQPRPARQPYRQYQSQWWRLGPRYRLKYKNIPSPTTRSIGRSSAGWIRHAALPGGFRSRVMGRVGPAVAKTRQMVSL